MRIGFYVKSKKYPKWITVTPVHNFALTDKIRGIIEKQNYSAFVISNVNKWGNSWEFGCPINCKVFFNRAIIGGNVENYDYIYITEMKQLYKIGE